MGTERGETVSRARIAQLQELYPEAESRSALLEAVARELAGAGALPPVWAGRAAAEKELAAPAAGRLEPAPDSGCDQLIEGDNLDVLKLLCKRYAGAVDLIYIDPPYNTGRPFVYRDRFVSPDGDPHAAWKTLLYPRLAAALPLLAEDGALFVSIGERELPSLLELCRELFGEERCGVLVWEKTGQGDAGAGRMKSCTRFRVDHEYLVYGYLSDRFRINRLQRIPQFKNSYTNPDNDPRGPYKGGNISRTEARSKPQGKNFYTVTAPGGRRISRQFHFDRAEFARLEREKRIYWGKDKNGIPQLKIFLSEPRPVVCSSVLREAGSATAANKHLRSLFGGVNPFPNAKPLQLIELLLELFPKPDPLVLDFFAGSCTTGAAVWSWNKKTGNNARFICVQSGEPVRPGSPAEQAGYATVAEIGRERLRREAELLGGGCPLQHLKPVEE